MLLFFFDVSYTSFVFFFVHIYWFQIHHFQFTFFFLVSRIQHKVLYEFKENCLQQMVSTIYIMLYIHDHAFTLTVFYLILKTILINGWHFSIIIRIFICVSRILNDPKHRPIIENLSNNWKNDVIENNY